MPRGRVEAVVFYTCAGSAELFPTMRTVHLYPTAPRAGPRGPGMHAVSRGARPGRRRRVGLPVRRAPEGEYRSGPVGCVRRGVEKRRRAGVRPSRSRVERDDVAAASDATRYVQQYSTTSDRMLKVGFDGKAMDRLLQQAGLPLWPLERPVTQVLLVTGSAAGGARAIVEGERVAERAEVERAARIVACRSRGRAGPWTRQQCAPSSRVALPAPRQAWIRDRCWRHRVRWQRQLAIRAARADRNGGWHLQDGANLAADSLAARYAPPSTRGMSGHHGARRRHGRRQGLCRAARIPQVVEPRAQRGGRGNGRRRRNTEAGRARRPRPAAPNCRNGRSAATRRSGRAEEGATPVDFTFKP